MQKTFSAMKAAFMQIGYFHYDFYCMARGIVGVGQLGTEVMLTIVTIGNRQVHFLYCMVPVYHSNTTGKIFFKPGRNLSWVSPLVFFFKKPPMYHVIVQGREVGGGYKWG